MVAHRLQIEPRAYFSRHVSFLLSSHSEIHFTKKHCYQKPLAFQRRSPISYSVTCSLGAAPARAGAVTDLSKLRTLLNVTWRWGGSVISYQWLPAPAPAKPARRQRVTRDGDAWRKLHELKRAQQGHIWNLNQIDFPPGPSSENQTSIRRGWFQINPLVKL